MRICHLCSSHVDAPYYSYLGKRLTQRGSKQYFVTFNADEPAWITQNTAVEYHKLGVASKVQYPLAILRLARFLKQNKIDVMQTHLFDASLVGLAAAKIAGTRAKIVSRHHLDDGALTGTRIHTALDRFADESADLVVVPSRATMRYMIDVEKQKGDNIRVVPYGFDFDVLNATNDDRMRVRREFGIDDRFVIGIVGRFVPGKGHRFLFEAVRDLKYDYPNITVLVLGNGDKSYLDEIIAQFGIGDKVLFAGYRTDIPACMKAMDILVHPSLSESFGQVIVEAMCVETPVIVTAVGGVPEIVENESTGIVVEPSDANAIRDAIKRLIDEPAVRQRFGKQGKTSVYENFSVDRFIEKQWACYAELIDNI